MSIRCAAGSPVVVCCTQAALGRKILAHLQSHQQHASVEFECTETLEVLIDRPDVSVAFLVLASADAASVDAGDCELASLLEFLPRLRKCHLDSQALLVCGGKLSTGQSFEIIRGGISAIIDCRRGDFAECLAGNLEAPLERYRDGVRRRQHEARGVGCEKSGLVGRSKALQKVLGLALRAAAVSDVPVLITGESGTGKQRVAEFIHREDAKRGRGAFVTVNCGAITGTLAESELFGHRKGAFTGANESRLGYFRTAHEGTISLDEISELDLSLQPKLLRVLQESQVRPVGSGEEHAIDVRIITATNRDLAEEVATGRFRLDLYQRLKVIQLTVPPLRHRLEDIPLLVDTFLQKYAHYYSGTIKRVDPQVFGILAQSVGSGNVRELENIMRRILIFKESGGVVGLGDIPEDVLAVDGSSGERSSAVEIAPETIRGLIAGVQGLGEAMEAYEKGVLARLLDQESSPTRLARHLGISRRTLYNKLQKYRLR